MACILKIKTNKNISDEFFLSNGQEKKFTDYFLQVKTNENQTLVEFLKPNEIDSVQILRKKNWENCFSNSNLNLNKETANATISNNNTNFQIWHLNQKSFDVIVKFIDSR